MRLKIFGLLSHLAPLHARLCRFLARQEAEWSVSGYSSDAQRRFLKIQIQIGRCPSNCTCSIDKHYMKPIATIDFVKCVRDLFNNLLVALTAACITYFRTCVTPLLLIDLDLPTDSHSSLQRLINFKTCYFVFYYNSDISCLVFILFVPVETGMNTLHTLQKS